VRKIFLFGLGNPGKEYYLTRHNAGYLFIDYFFRKEKFTPGKGNFFYAEKDNFVGILPTLFMNENGRILFELKNNFSLKIEDIIVFLDDFNLPFGGLRFRKKGSSGGHRGLESVIYYAETEEIKRLRIGIGFDYNLKARDYVLTDFNKEELEFLKNKVFPYIEEGIYKFLKNYDINNFENYINNYPWKQRVQIPEEDKEEKK